MADYAMVRDQSGDVCGLWIRDEAQAEDRVLLCMLLVKHGLAQSLQEAALSGSYRVVPNRVDSNGGCFIMFGSAPAPGEFRSAQTPRQSAQSSRGCFIATACYGSPDCPEVRTLRQFRDKVMMPSLVGRILIATYYRLSPPIAQTLNRHAALRVCVRERIVDPVVRWIDR